ncbi:Guanine nucleotidebinding proteinlike 3 -like protein [Caligus rogercresseyi]|uniref:Guanine nucleotidebinding proteinlike 3 -like protein n=1 Tax=Caligus rogercresseyi TaxID=217165 RepID=A0A7T8GXT7_CALRO|nr:Guanine nucleotidebinding proteinlike 3 -like protein [Caligus rogercresseyi]
MESEELDKLPEVLNSETMQVDSSGINNKLMMALEGSDDILPSKISIMETDETSAKKTSSKEDDPPKFMAEKQMKLKKIAKLREKKDKKNLKRREALGNDLANNMESAFDTMNDEDYNFDQDFKT